MSALAGFPRVTPFVRQQHRRGGRVLPFDLSQLATARRAAQSRRTPLPEGAILTIAFELDGCKFTALNGGPDFKFNQAISLVVRCGSQEEVDYYWSRLTVDGGKEVQCGWLVDKFGVSWQVTPARAIDLIRNPRAFQAMMGMKKLDLAELERAAQG